MPKIGWKHPPESKAKMAAAHRGSKHSQETKTKMAAAHRGERAYNWNGGRITNGHGYAYLLRPDHPFATNMGYVLEHRLVMEAHLGRTLLPTEIVHHINGTVNDNCIENLMLFSSSGKHMHHHLEQRRKEKNV